MFSKTTIEFDQKTFDAFIDKLTESGVDVCPGSDGTINIDGGDAERIADCVSDIFKEVMGGIDFGPSKSSMVGKEVTNGERTSKVVSEDNAFGRDFYLLEDGHVVEAADFKPVVDKAAELFEGVKNGTIDLDTFRRLTGED